MGTSASPARTFTTDKLSKRHLTSDNMLRLASLFLLVSAWCLTSEAAQCNRELQKDTDFLGDDLIKTQAKSTKECQAACTKQETCQYFTFVPKRNACHLKASRSGKPSRVRRNRICVSGFSLRGCAQCTRELQKDTDFLGDDIRNGRSKIRAESTTECQAACTKYETCQFFTFVPKSNACHLKASRSGKPSRVRRNRICVSGFSLRGCAQCNRELQKDTDFLGDDIRNGRSKIRAESTTECQ